MLQYSLLLVQSRTLLDGHFSSSSFFSFVRLFDPAVQSSANSPSAKDYLPSLYSSRQQYFRRLLHLFIALLNALSPEAIVTPLSSCPAPLPEKLRAGTTGEQYGIAAFTTFFAKPRFRRYYVVQIRVLWVAAR